MHPDTERMIRSQIRWRCAPLYLAFWVFLGTIVSLGLIGGLGFLERFLRSNRWIH